MLQDAAESLGITISDAVSGALASDVEYRIHQVIEVTIDIDNSIIIFLNACRKLHVSCAMDDEQHLQHLTSTMHSGLSILNLFMGISRFLSHHIEKLCHFLKFPHRAQVNLLLDLSTLWKMKRLILNVS